MYALIIVFIIVAAVVLAARWYNKYHVSLTETSVINSDTETTTNATTPSTVKVNPYKESTYTAQYPVTPSSSTNTTPPTYNNTPSQPASIKWSKMKDWAIKFSSTPKYFADAPGETDEATIKKMCEDIAKCKAVTFDPSKNKWYLQEKIVYPTWLKGGVTLVNERDTDNYGKMYPSLPTRDYKELAGVVPDNRNGKPTAVISGVGKSLEHIKSICNSFQAMGECNVITQDDKNMYYLWPDVYYGEKLLPSLKSWVTPRATAYRAGKYLKTPTQVGNTQYFGYLE